MIKPRLMKLLKGSGKYVAWQVFWQWAGLAGRVVFFTCLTALLRSVLEGNPLADTFLPLFLTMVLSVLVRALCGRMSVRASFMAGADVRRVLRGRIYDKLLRLGRGCRDQVRTAELMQLASEGVEQLETYYGKYLAQLFYSLLAPLTLFLYLMRFDLRSALVLFVCVPLIPAVIVIVQKIAKRILRSYLDIYMDLGDSFLDSIQGMTVLKIFGADRRRAREMDRESERFRKVTMKVLQMQLNSVIVMDIVAYGGAAAGMLTALSSYTAGRTDAAGALMILFLALDYFLPMRLLGSFFHIAMNGMTASDRIFAFLDLPEPEAGTQVLEGDQVSLNLQGVRYAYPAREEEEAEPEDALRGVSLKAPAGSLIGIAGESGCGKSTAAALMAGMLRGYRGHIYLNGKELSDIREDSLLSHVTLVSSGAFIFSGTVEDNLRMADPDAAEDRLWEVLERVRLADFVRAGGGLSYRLLEGGSNLSGGQRQRLALARALLRDAPVLILDEATSNIDLESEAMIMDVIRSLRGSKTILLISHRLANIRDADRIYLFEKGRTTENGTHEDLLRWKGHYERMYKEQMETETFSGASAGEAPAEAPPLQEEEGREEEIPPLERRAGLSIMKRLIRLVKPLVPIMVLAILLGVLGQLCSIFVTVLAGRRLMVLMGLKGPAGEAGAFALLLMGIAVSRGILHYGEQYCNHYIAFRLLALIRHKVFEALRRLCPARLEGKDKGNLISILTTDIELLEVFYAHTISPIAIALVTGLIMTVCIGVQYPPAALLALAAYLTVGALIPVRIGRRNARGGMASRTAFGAMNSFLLESMRGLDETIQYGRGRDRAARLDERSRGLTSIQEGLSRIEGIQQMLTELLSMGFVLILAVLVLTAAETGRISPDGAVMALFGLLYSYGPVFALSRLANDLGQTLASGERVLRLLEEEPAVEEVRDGEVADPEELALGLEARDVTFSYPGGSRVLTDFSALFPAGTVTGICGPSGCGKSTLLRLLMRFWDPDQGQVLAEGTDLRRIQTRNLRRIQACVFQETYLFDDTISANISMEGEDGDPCRIRLAAKAAAIDSFIEGLPGGYDTRVGELGDTLSEGQKQRIGIARALYHDAPVLLLDEPTSSLDILNEGLILKALQQEQRRKKRTIIMVSHRRSALRMADQVLDMDAGQAT